jgi:hypothetical protein
MPGTCAEAELAALPAILEILLCPVLNEPGRDRSNRCARRVNVADGPEHRPQDPARLARRWPADINLDDLAARLPRAAYQVVLTRAEQMRRHGNGEMILAHSDDRLGQAHRQAVRIAGNQIAAAGGHIVVLVRKPEIRIRPRPAPQQLREPHGSILPGDGGPVHTPPLPVQGPAADGLRMSRSAASRAAGFIGGPRCREFLL